MSDKTQTVEGRVRDVTQAGESVIETAQGLVLAHGGLPSERVRLSIEGKRAGVLRGRVLSVIETSPHRVSPVCNLVERCGGCPLMALDAEGQRALKLQRATRALEGVCEPGVVIEHEAPGPALGYRRRVRMAFRRSGKHNVLGYHALGASTVVDTPACPVLEAALQRGLDQVRASLLGLLAGSGEIELVKAEVDAVVVSVSCDAPLSPDTYRAAEKLATQPGIAGVTLRVQGGAPAKFGAAQQVSLGSDGVALAAPASSFAQANAAVNQRMVERVVELAEPSGARVLELYAGHGNLTVALAKDAVALTAFELDQAAADACRANLRARGMAHVRVYASDAEAAKTSAQRADVLVLDPPRAGAPALADIVAHSKPERVVYVSCHVTTLARDLRAIAALGYRVDRAHVLDMFPQTAHVEAVVRLRRTATPAAAS